MLDTTTSNNVIYMSEAGTVYTSSMNPYLNILSRWDSELREHFTTFKFLEH